jgi:hypothetical protein
MFPFHPTKKGGGASGAASPAPRLWREDALGQAMKLREHLEKVEHA